MVDIDAITKVATDFRQAIEEIGGEKLGSCFCNFPVVLVVIHHIFWEPIF